MFFLIFDNRSVGVTFGFGPAGKVDFEVEAGISAYLLNAGRSMFQLFGIHREAMRSQRWGLFVAQNPNCAHLKMWNNLKMRDMADLLTSRYAIPSGHDTWSGFMASALHIMNFRKSDLLLNTSRISLKFITNEIALFGTVRDRAYSLDSVESFSSLLNELRRTTGIRIDCYIVCFKICKDSNSDFVSLVCQSNSQLSKRTVDLSPDSGITEIISTDNTPIHFEAEVRRILLSTKSTISSTLLLPQAQKFKCSIDLELMPGTIDALLSLHDGLRELSAVTVFPQTGIQIFTVEGKPLLVRAMEHENFARNRSNLLAFVALNRMLRNSKKVLLVKSRFCLPPAPVTSKQMSTSAHQPDSKAYDDLKYDQHWLLIPHDEDSKLVDVMVMIKLISGDDVLFDGSDSYGKPVIVTADEEQEVSLIQNALSWGLEGSEESFISEVYNPCAYISGKIETWVVSTHSFTCIHVLCIKLHFPIFITTQKRMNANNASKLEL
jgi:hypothetical protein